MEKNPLKVVLGKHRLSYVHLKTPTAFEEGNTPKYSVTVLIPKDHPDVAKIEAAIKASYNANKESTFKGTPLTSPKMHNPLRDGDEYVADKPDATEYKGMFYLKATSTSQPAVYDNDKQELFDLDEVYSGCYARAVIVCFPFNNVSKGHGFYLNSVMKIADGERLGGFTASADDYEDEDDAPAPKRTKAVAKPVAKPKRIFDEDADGNAIYSDDNGESWFFSE